MDKKNLCVLLLGLFISLSEIQETKAVKSKLVNCIKGNPFKNLYRNERKNIRWTEICDSKTCDLTTIVQGCAKDAAAKGYHTFAVHYYGECREANLDHYKAGECFGKESGMPVGTDESSAVYQVDTSCSNGRKDGAKWEVPLAPDICRKCGCEKGEDKCSLIHCDHEYPCEKYIPSAKCCSNECACHYNKTDKKEGEEWADRKTAGVCRECRCIHGKSVCNRPVKCNVNCPKPEIIPGKCCPWCAPKAPTTRPWETLPTTRARPTFPFWGKRISRKRFDWSSLRQ